MIRRFKFHLALAVGILVIAGCGAPEEGPASPYVTSSQWGFNLTRPNDSLQGPGGALGDQNTSVATSKQAESIGDTPSVFPSTDQPTGLPPAGQ